LRPVSLAIIGCGNVMTGAYTTLLKRLVADRTVGRVAVFDVDRGAAERAARIYGDEGPAEDHRQLLESEHIDIVVVLTSMAEHGPLALEALEAGKHVFVEKPMAVTREGATELLAASRTSAGHLVCAPAVILSPTFGAIAAALRADAIGTPALARARYGWSGPDWSEWYYRESGGPLFDLGVYNVTSLTGLLGPVRGVQAMAGIVTPHRLVGGDVIDVSTFDNYQILLDFGDDVFGIVTTGFSMQKYRSPALEIYGSTGTVQMLGDDWAPDGYELWENSVGAWQVFESSRTWSWTDGLGHLIACVAAGETPLMTPDHAFHVLDVMLTAIDAAEQRSYVAVESSFSMPQVDARESATPAHRIHDRTSV
jgi:predicted dehydrogenase